MKKQSLFAWDFVAVKLVGLFIIAIVLVVGTVTILSFNERQVPEKNVVGQSAGEIDAFGVRSPREAVDVMDFFLTKNPDKSLMGAFPLSQVIAGNNLFYIKYGNPEVVDAYTWDERFVYLKEGRQRFSNEDIRILPFSLSPGIWMERRMLIGETIGTNSEIQWFDGECKPFRSEKIHFEIVLEKRDRFFDAGSLGKQDVIVLKVDKYKENYDTVYATERFYYSKEWGLIRWELYDKNTQKVFDFNEISKSLIYPQKLCSPTTDNSQFIEHWAEDYQGKKISIEKLVAAKPYTLYVKMKNIGTSTWKPGEYYLNSLNPENNTNWSKTGRMEIDTTVFPGQEAIFKLEVRKAPPVGVYSFQWRMVRETNTERKFFGFETVNEFIIVVQLAKDENAI